MPIKITISQDAKTGIVSQEPCSTPSQPSRPACDAVSVLESLLVSSDALSYNQTHLAPEKNVLKCVSDEVVPVTPTFDTPQTSETARADVSKAKTLISMKNHSEEKMTKTSAKIQSAPKKAISVLTSSSQKSIASFFRPNTSKTQAESGSVQGATKAMTSKEKQGDEDKEVKAKKSSSHPASIPRVVPQDSLHNIPNGGNASHANANANSKSDISNVTQIPAVKRTPTHRKSRSKQEPKTGPRARKTKKTSDLGLIPPSSPTAIAFTAGDFFPPAITGSLGHDAYSLSWDNEAAMVIDALRIGQQKAHAEISEEGNKLGNAVNTESSSMQQPFTEITHPVSHDITTETLNQSDIALSKVESNNVVNLTDNDLMDRNDSAVKLPPANATSTIIPNESTDHNMISTKDKENIISDPVPQNNMISDCAQLKPSQTPVSDLFVNLADDDDPHENRNIIDLVTEDNLVASPMSTQKLSNNNTESRVSDAEVNLLQPRKKRSKPSVSSSGHSTKQATVESHNEKIAPPTSHMGRGRNRKAPTVSRSLETSSSTESTVNMSVTTPDGLSIAAGKAKPSTQQQLSSCAKNNSGETDGIQISQATPIISILKPRSKKAKTTQPASGTPLLANTTQDFVSAENKAIIEDGPQKAPTLGENADKNVPQATIANQSITRNETGDCMKSEIVNLDKTEASLSIDDNVSPRSSLSQEVQAILKRNQQLTINYSARAEDIIQRVLQGLIEEEDFAQIGSSAEEEEFSILETSVNVSAPDSVFRDEWLPDLAIIVQGSHLSLRSLTHKVYTQICARASAEGCTVSYVSVMEKIKLVAHRKQYLGGDTKIKIDRFQDTDERSMWRWELVSIDLLPDDLQIIVKKARTNRTKLQSHHRAIMRLLSALREFSSLIETDHYVQQEIINMMLAKIADEEEKVLRFERENEKNRLLQEVKVQKQKEKERQQAQKQQERDRLEDEKRLEKIRREEEKDKKKKEAIEIKRRKEDEAIKEKEKLTEMRKARLISFFKTTSTHSQEKEKESHCTISTDQIKESVASHHEYPPVLPDSSAFDSETFWKLINARSCVPLKPLFPMTSSSHQSRKRRTRVVVVTVFVTSIAENEFDTYAYDEEKSVSVRNKFKFLGFYEDYRPPYNGTWSRPKSTVVKGTNPFGQDKSLDYSYDSEAEWEEGDDDQGEDCSDSGNEEEELDDEEGDTRFYNYQDGWLADDAEVDKVEGEEEDDEETKALRRLKLAGINSTGIPLAYVLGPRMGGLPLDMDCPDLLPESVQGVDVLEAKSLLRPYFVELLTPTLDIWMDAFPPSDEVDDKAIDFENVKSSTNQAEMTEDHLRTFVKFVHKSTYKSKECVVEELRQAHKDITSSRAQATRTLDSVAIKKRAKNGVIWEVKAEVLQALGLQHLDIESVKHDVTISTSSPQEPSVCIQETPSIHKQRSPTPTETNSPVRVSPSTTDNGGLEKLTDSLSDPKKRKYSQVSEASVNLLAQFFAKKKKEIDASA